MKSAVLALAALVATTAAQSLAPLSVQSKPFRLVLHSGNASFDSTVLAACHEGAAIEALCPSGQKLSDPASPSTTFYHNVTDDNAPNAIDVSGSLVWYLHYSGGIAPSVMNVSPFGLTSNVAIPIISPGGNESQFTPVAFEDSGAMYISMNSDDRVVPPKYLQESLKVENWYTCVTNWAYTFVTLTWKIGLTGEPQNPSCQKVEVQRVFVGEEDQAFAKMSKAQHLAKAIV